VTQFDTPAGGVMNLSQVTLRQAPHRLRRLALLLGSAVEFGRSRHATTAFPAASASHPDLDPSGRLVLRVLGVARGTLLEAAQLEAMTGLPADRLDSAIAELVRSGRLVEESTGGRPVRYRAER
jgi:hypothetical protein